MADYNIGNALSRIETELIESMMRNFSRHRAEETELGYDWAQWQALQLQGLEAYRRRNQSRFPKRFRSINKQLEKAIRDAHKKGGAEQEAEILEAIKAGADLHRSAGTMGGAFFRVNERKLNALLDATKRDVQKAEYAVLRRANDAYRKVIFDAQVYANAGGTTYEKAVDMATKDFLSAGLTCVTYKNGARHTLSDYADMALKTAVKRAYLQGEGQMRQQWGIATVILNKRTNACPKCAKFAGKVFIDDVWSGGKASDGDYPLLSSAIAQGLYHPRCKDSHTTFFEGITDDESLTKPYSKVEMEQLAIEDFRQEKAQHAQRQAEKYQRLEEFSLDPENQKEYGARAEEWKQETNQNAKLKAKELGVNASYSNFNPEFAECINDCIETAQKRFGSLSCLRNVRGVTMPNPKEYAGYGKGTQTLFLHNPSNSDILKQMKKDAEFQFSMGGWSTGDYRHAIMHEIGHAIEKQHLTRPKKAILEEVRKEALFRVTGSADISISPEGESDNQMLRIWGQKAKAELSLYGLSSAGELIAESVAQMLLGEPTSLAQKVMRILLE